MKLAIVCGWSFHHTTSDHNVGSHWVMTGFSRRRVTLSGNERPSVGSIVARPLGAATGRAFRLTSPLLAPCWRSRQACVSRPGFQPVLARRRPRRGREGPLPRPAGRPEPRPARRPPLPARQTRPARPPSRRRRGDGGDGPLHGRGVRDGHWSSPRVGRSSTSLAKTRRPRDRYGRTQVGQSCLLARRLVEAGVTFVTISEGNWDHHGQVFANCKRQLPPLDAAIASLQDVRGPPRAAVSTDKRPAPRLGRVRPDPAHQRQWARPLAGQHVRGRLGRRIEDRPGHRRDQRQGRIPHRTRLASRRRAPYSLSRARHRSLRGIPQRRRPPRWPSSTTGSRSAELL